jgi:hypothetical protein
LRSISAFGLNTLPRSLKAFWVLNVGLGLLAMIIYAFIRWVLHWGEPYNFPFLPFRHFADFWAFHDRFDHYHTLAFYSTTGGSKFSYPAPLSLVYKLFFLPHRNEHTIFTIATALPCIALAWLLGRAMLRAGVERRQAWLFVGCSAVLSYPFWFEYFLGNIEICVFLIAAAGLIAWLRGHTYLGAALIGAAGSMKIFPFILLALCLSRKQYRQFAVGILTAAILYPLSIWMACPSFAVAIPEIRASSAALGQNVVMTWDQILIEFDHSLFGVYKQATHMLGFSNYHSAHELSLYTGVTALAGIALYFLVIRRLPLMNQILSLTVASILLPPMSNDYTLLYLYVPWGLLVLSVIEDFKAGMERAGTIAAFVCFALLLSPESELIIRHQALSGQFKALILIALLYISLKYPLPLPRGTRIDETHSTDLASAILVN